MQRPANQKSTRQTPATPHARRIHRGSMPVWIFGLALALILGVAAPLLLAPNLALWAQTDNADNEAAEEDDTEADTEAADEAEDAETDTPADGYLYTVRSGDSWPAVAQRTGVSEQALRAANPDKVRDTGWLIEGEELLIPVATGTPQRVHEVQVGESWSSIADRYAVPVSLLQAANPRAVRSGMLLYRGERLVVPPPPTADTDTDADADDTEADAPEADIADPTEDVEDTVEAAATAEPTEEPTAEPTEEPTQEPAEEAAPEPTATATQTPTAMPEPTVAATEEPTEEPAEDVVEADADETDAATTGDIPACPSRFLDYPQAMTAAINADAANGPATLQAFLTECGALVDDGYVAEDLTGNEIDDVVVIYQNPSVDTIFVESDLVIFNGSDDGYELAYRARAAGEVRLLTVADINADDLVDVVWIDTTCGASTCFDTVNVRSWSSATWADWTEGTITMAYATVELTDTSELDLPATSDDATDTEAETEAATDESVDTGQAIVLQGGIYGSVGAGPQRSRVEIWGSRNGEPYALLDRRFMESECLYHVVIDANAALLEGWSDDFAQASALYAQAVDDTDLLTCWVRADEENELRSFSMFRQALIAGYRDDLETATEHAEAVIDAYPETPYEAVAAIWLREYRATGNAAEACTVVTQFAEQTPATWEMLADYGYTNPSFKAADVCPVLVPPDPDPDSDAADPDADSEGDETNGNEEADENAGAPEGALASFPECPQDLAGFPTTLPSVLRIAADDADLIEAWLTACRAMDDSRGAVRLSDITGDGITDAVLFPVLVTDLGFGPGGAQGTTLIFHGTTNGNGNGSSNVNSEETYELVANPEIYGMPEPLTIADLNGDGQIEVAWGVTGCSTFCVTEVQMWSWTGAEYVPAILPGATMANAEIDFQPVDPSDPEGAQRLVLYGGVSGTPDGGLETPHWEEWQSVEAGPYQRVRWEYDRTVADNACLGLRLIEADVALQAAPQIGYGPAQELYTNALADLAAGDLEACSLMEMPAATELSLLEGLANFRMIQIYGLTGELEAARAELADFEVTAPDSEYATLARTWLDAYAAGLPAGAADADADAAALDIRAAADAACAQVLPTLDATPALWQVTDQYGYNHPVLAAEQICFVP
ncbi:MAG: LysM domain-containing protein [Litorilinea sp.]